MKREIETLHKPFIAYLRKNGLLYINARSDQKSGIAEGHCDFTVFLPESRVCCVEFKLPGNGKLSPKQRQRLDDLKPNTDWIVARDLEVAIRYVESRLPGKLGTDAVERPNEPSVKHPKRWIVHSNQVGEIVVCKQSWGLEFVRTASSVDLLTIPRLPQGFI